MSDAGHESEVLSYAGASQAAERGEVFCEGGMLVVRSGVVLPRRCVMCDGAVEERGRPLKLTFTWDASFTVTKGSALELRRKGTVKAFLCAGHGLRWRMGRTAGIALMVASVLLMVGGLLVTAASELSDVPRDAMMGIAVLMAGFGGMIGSLFWFTLGTRTLSCVKIEEGYLYLRGAGEGFMAGIKGVSE